MSDSPHPHLHGNTANFPPQDVCVRLRRNTLEPCVCGFCNTVTMTARVWSRLRQQKELQWEMRELHVKHGESGSH